DVCDAPDARGGSWSGNTIIFAGRYTPVFRVPATGGERVAVTALGADGSHRWPRFLPDGEHFLFLASPVGAEDPRNTICVGSLATKMRKAVASASSQPLYSDGFLVFVRDGSLTAQQFDPKTLTTVRDPIPLPEQEI